jgi:hypothetical protein
MERNDILDLYIIHRYRRISDVRFALEDASSNLLP